jgi:hypothetical protein
MRIKPTQRVGLSALRAVGVEQEIMKIPKHEVVVALGRPEALVVRGVDPEKDLAIHQQRKETDSRKIVLPPEPADSLRCRQGREDGRNVRIANPEQRAGARRFQHHFMAAPSQIREPGQHDHFGIAELWRSRPVIGNLRFDDDQVVAVTRWPEAVLQQAAPGQAPNQQIDFLVGRAAVGRKGGERQTRTQVLRARHGAGAELSEADRIAIETSDDISVGLRFKRDVTAHSRGNAWCDFSPSLFSGSAQSRMALKCAEGTG